MKKSDFAMIILIAGISVLVSYMLVGQLPFLKATDKGQEVPKADSIVSTVDEPNPEIFNSSSINPTVQIEIGGGAGQPFTSDEE